MKIFAYWDKPESIPAYLQLCVATWQIYGDVDAVQLITDANLHEWIADGVLDMETLADYPIPQRKDAIEIAMLARYGGLFIDLDTICSAPLSALKEALADVEIALYGFHLSTVAAQPGSMTVARWLELLQATLRVPREQLMAATGLTYTELGNYSFELLRDELASGRCATPAERPAKVVRLWRKLLRHRMLKYSRQKYIAQLDPRGTGYIAEYDHRRQDTLTAKERYQSFWFDPHLPLSAVTAKEAALIGLHHSWTPAQYSVLGFAELAADQSLLSRYLRHLLEGYPGMRTGENCAVDLTVFKAATQQQVLA
ncbi:MAG: capsular polysaccharide synthesis protein [Halioglobus sp.]